MRVYILFFCVLLLFVAYTRGGQTEGFQDAEPKPFALLLRGEAFRKGGQGTRAIGAEDIYDDQIAACKTHMDLVRAIEARGYTVEVFVDTYSTQYDNQLKAVYGPHLKDARFHKTRFGTQTMLLKDGVEMIGSDSSPTLLILRLDMFLKPAFMELYDPSVPMIQFFSICAHGWHKTPKGNPRINDTVFHFPSTDTKRAEMLYSNPNLIGWHGLLDNEPLKYNTDYSLMTTRYYDSDSGKDQNPYYRIVGRQESPEWRSEGKEFPGDD